MVDSTVMQSGRYKAYPEYKDSGVEWLGEIPSHWQVKRLGQFFKERREKVSDKDYPPLSVTMKGIVPQLENAAKSDAGDNRKLVLKNDFVINSRSDRKGSSGISSLDGSVSLISIVLEPKGISPRYAHHLLRSYNFQEEFYRHGKGIVADLWSTNSSEMKDILIPEISENESNAIASFLDHETAKIDSLIEKQQRLIELLTEKRQAVISHAVTKGLNPDVPMKDSGVEWLGEIPEHWEVKKLKHVATYNDDVLSEKTDANFKIQYVDISSVSSINGIQDSIEIVFKDAPSRARRVVKDGDVIVSTVRTYLRAIAPIVNPPANLIVSTGFTVIRPKNEMFKDYVANFLLSEVFISEVVSRSVGISYPAINSSDLMDIYICNPPHNEQVLICEYISNVLQKIDILISKSSKQIQLMQERRTALISAAVTGKIDIRDWVKPE